MAINLLSYLPTIPNSPIQLGNQTTTPMGVKATSPTYNISTQPATLPKSQTISPTASTSYPNGAMSSYPSGQIVIAQQPSIATPKPVTSSASFASGALTPEQIANAKTPEQILASDPSKAAPVQQPQTQTQSPQSTTPTTQGTLASLIQMAQNGSSTLQDAITAQRNLQQRIAEQYGNIESSGIPLEFAQGREQILGRQYAAQQQAAQQAVSNALSGQGQQIGALESALGTLTQTTPAPYGTPLYQPSTGQFLNSGGGNLDPQTQAINLAKQVMNGQITYDQALSSLGYAGNIGTTFLNNAITSAGGNPLQLQSQGAGQQSVLQSIPGLQSANTAAEGIKNTITSYLAQNPNLNASQFAGSNILQRWINGEQLTDPKYKTLFNYLDEYTNTLAPILGVGGNPTNLKTQIAQGFIDAAASGKSISEVLANMSQLAAQKIQNIQSGATGGGIVSNNSSTTPMFGNFFGQ